MLVSWFDSRFGALSPQWSSFELADSRFARSGPRSSRECIHECDTRESASARGDETGAVSIETDDDNDTTQVVGDTVETE